MDEQARAWVRAITVAPDGAEALRAAAEKLGKVVLDEDVVDAVEDLVYDGLHSWDHSDTQADWCCRFCNERPPNNTAPIDHRSDCRGVWLLGRIAKVMKR